MKNLCLAGGVALNCVGNGRILREGPFEKLWIQPAAGDAGGALGAALFIWHQLLGKPRQAGRRRPPARLALGPAFSDDEIRGFLDARGAKYRHFADEQELVRARGRAAGRGEGRRLVPGADGVRPAGAGRRSILGDARSRAMQSHDEPEDQVPRIVPPLRAGGAPRARPPEYFEMRDGEESPYMLLVAPVRRGATACPATAKTRDGHRQAQDRPLHRARPSPTSTTPPACRRLTPSGTGGSTS